jgi:DNA processing protein
MYKTSGRANFRLGAADTIFRSEATVQYALERRSRLSPMARAETYNPPPTSGELTLSQVKDFPQNSKLLLTTPAIYFAGDPGLLERPRVAIVGSRDVSKDGSLRTTRLARELVAAGVVVVSGLAKGVDAAAHRSAIENGGRTIAVIGTPLDKAYPAENAELQETIWREHLLISQFPKGSPTSKSSFPERNKLMAALSHVTVIMEASDKSGTLHQAAECVRLGRPLFIARSVVEDPTVLWPKRFLKPDLRVYVLNRVTEIFAVMPADV